MSLTIDHLALVFHRFLEDGLRILVNNVEIEALDPFLLHHKSTQILREQKIKFDDSDIAIQPYILPYINKLSNEDIKKVGGKDNLKTKQGFYIYRNRRLIIWGTWFKLVRKEELSKLARVKVDIPSSLDYMWGIDIKKSSVNLPDLIKRNLYSSISESIFTSKNVLEYRGRKTKNDGTNYVWERIELRDGNYEYKINREIPQLKMLSMSLDADKLELLNLAINCIESSFPITSLYLDASKGEIKDEYYDINKLYDELRMQMEWCDNNGFNSEEMLDLLLKTEPYCNYSELKEMLKCEVV